jgi:hypothetical protein
MTRAVLTETLLFIGLVYAIAIWRGNLADVVVSLTQWLLVAALVF